MKNNYFLATIVALCFMPMLAFSQAQQPTEAPAAPTHESADVLSLFCNAYEATPLLVPAKMGFENWQMLNVEGTVVAYADAMTWGAFTPSDDKPIDASSYEKLHFDIWVPEASHVNIKVEGVSYQNSIHFGLNAGWNTIDADPAWWDKDAENVHNWSDIKFFIIESYKKADNQTSAEGTPLAVANVYFWKTPVANIPTDAPAVPERLATDVLSLNCKAYETEAPIFVPANMGFDNWQTLELNGANVLYANAMTWGALGTTDNSTIDASAFEKLHFDIWVPEASHVNIKVEGVSYQNSIHFGLNAGWNTIDADPAWWDKDAENVHNWSDIKFIIIESYKKADNETSAEGSPLAIANIYFWNTPAPTWPDNAPATTPAAPTHAESGVQALFSTTYATNNFHFAPTSWGAAWQDLEYENGEHIWYTDAFGWDAFTNWDADKYAINMSYDMFRFDIYVTVDSKIKVTFEALKAAEGGSDWKNGAVFENLKANQWNTVVVDLLAAPFDTYDFQDFRYLILEGFQTAQGESAEGTPVALANAYFYSSMTDALHNNEGTQARPQKRIVNGQLIIEFNGKQYNVLGTQL